MSEFVDLPVWPTQEVLNKLPVRIVDLNSTARCLMIRYFLETTPMGMAHIVMLHVGGVGMVYELADHGMSVTLDPDRHNKEYMRVVLYPNPKAVVVDTGLEAVKAEIYEARKANAMKRVNQIVASARLADNLTHVVPVSNLNLTESGLEMLLGIFHQLAVKVTVTDGKLVVQL